MSQAKREKRKTIAHLNKIVSISAAIAKEWDKKTIPLTTLKVILDKAKANTDNKLANEHALQFNKTLGSLYELCASTAKNMDSKSIPISEIKRGVDIIKKAYK